jgi:hypothetical protein
LKGVLGGVPEAILTVESGMPATALTLDSRLVVSRDQVSANLSGEAVILGMKEGVYFGVGKVGTRIWGLLSEPRPLRAVAARISAEFEVTQEQAERDLLAFASELVAQGLADVVAG